MEGWPVGVWVIGDREEAKILPLLVPSCSISAQLWPNDAQLSILNVVHGDAPFYYQYAYFRDEMELFSCQSRPRR